MSHVQGVATESDDIADSERRVKVRHEHHQRHEPRSGAESFLVAASPLLRAPQQFFQQFWFLLLASDFVWEETLSRKKPDELNVRTRQVAKAGSTGTCAWTSEDWTAETFWHGM